MLNNHVDVARRMRISHNVSLRVIDKYTRKVVCEHTGHNSATNSLLSGIGYYLVGEGVLNQGTAALKPYLPQYISLGTMGLEGQHQTESGLPVDIGGVASDPDYDPETCYTKYMNERPGYGADGYDASYNNNRPYFGLGYPYTTYQTTQRYSVDDIVTYQGVLYKCISPTELGPFDINKWNAILDLSTSGFEVMSPSFPRAKIAFRDVVPEIYAEKAKTLDIVYSAMISTGALAQFRGDNDYVFITEAGLWARPDWSGSMSIDNGLLAGYRILPPDSDNWDMSDPANREILQKNILRVGVNQVVQVIWKIQIGGIDEFPSDGPVQPVVNSFLWHIQGTVNRNASDYESPTWN